MWSGLAVLFGLGGALAGFALGEIDESPLSGSPRAMALALGCVVLLGAAALLAVVGLASWHWAVPATAVPTVVGIVRFYGRALPEPDETGRAREDLLRRHGPRGL
jgi:hypothetical protein